MYVRMCMSLHFVDKSALRQDINGGFSFRRIDNLPGPEQRFSPCDAQEPRCRGICGSSVDLVIRMSELDSVVVLQNRKQGTTFHRRASQGRCSLIRRALAAKARRAAASCWLLTIPKDKTFERATKPLLAICSVKPTNLLK